MVVNFKEAGKLLKSRIQEFKEKISNLDEEKMNLLVEMYNDKNTNNVEVPDFGMIPKEAFLVNEKPKKNIVLINENTYTVALDTTLNEDLTLEYLERELTRAIQVLRKEAGFKIEQRIKLGIETKGKLFTKVLEKYSDEIKTETLTIKFLNSILDDYEIKKTLEINDEEVVISLKGL